MVSHILYSRSILLVFVVSGSLNTFYPAMCQCFVNWTFEWPTHIRKFISLCLFWVQKNIRYCLIIVPLVSSFCVRQEPNERSGGKQDKLWDVQFWSSNAQLDNWCWKRCGSTQRDPKLLFHQWQRILLRRHESSSPRWKTTTATISFARKEQLTKTYSQRRNCDTRYFYHCSSVGLVSWSLATVNLQNLHTFVLFYLH